MDSLRENGIAGGSEQPNKRAKNHLPVDLVASNPSHCIEIMFYRTRLCCKFQLGTCPSINNCNFAHSIEELREPPPNWQEIVAAHKEEKGQSSKSREVCLVPIMGFSDNERQGSNMEQHYTEFFAEEGCPNGENCNSRHDEHPEQRESLAIYMVPGSGGGNAGNERKPTLNTSNWKTRICNKFELTGSCSYGSNCKFAHGAAELRCSGGTLMNTEVKNSSIPDTKQGEVPAKASVGTLDAPAPSVPYSYHTGVPLQKLPNMIRKTTEVPIRRWKGPDKISKIYGDWIDEL
ncbi:hypothetical protein CDL12_04441 [Handroanthus impetiginosus]|uniref:C3H1-type domain-containing protein n=1 Tax=Handroanthus impetiginosus TaxID=429701 RepID=A0A2G9HZB1_9LAMI|nr:hypothetical protein CDL12_04441 [Handroanthus impetiginosus]